MCLQLESAGSTGSATRKRQAALLPPPELRVVAAAVRAPVLHALVSPEMHLSFVFPVSPPEHGRLHASAFLQSPTGRIQPRNRTDASSVSAARGPEPAASGSPRQPGRPDERPGRRDPERRGAESGLVGLGLHRFPCRDLAERRLFLLLLQPLRHGDDSYAGALPVSEPSPPAPTTLHQNTVSLAQEMTWSGTFLRSDVCVQASGRLVPI